MRNQKFRILKGLTMLCLIGLLVGCQSNELSFKTIPTAFGNTNQIVVVADQDVWDGPVGDSIRYYYSSAYPILPQPEPIFDLKHFTPSMIAKEPVRRELRNYLIVGNLDNSSSAAAKFIKADIRSEKTERSKRESDYTSTLGKDKWAKGQQIFYVFSHSEEGLINALKSNFGSIATKVRKADQKQLEGLVYGAGENPIVINEVREAIGVDIKVPAGYQIAVQDSSFVWLRKDLSEVNKNIMIKKVNYTDKSQISQEGIKELRNEITKRYITTSIEGAYVHINDQDLPVLTETFELNGYYTLEARGIWETVNDFMGGPFISYLMLNESNGDLLFVDVFVHAPGKEKRNYMQQLERVVRTIHL